MSRSLHDLPADRYEYVVVDEFHHAAAPSYERLLDHVRPRVLLGLTATPERADGLDSSRHFGGHLSAQIRLPDAINRKLLSPFQYFAVTDSEDLAARDGSAAATGPRSSTGFTPAMTCEPHCDREGPLYPARPTKSQGVGLLCECRPCRVHGGQIPRGRHPRRGPLGRDPAGPTACRPGTVCAVVK